MLEQAALDTLFNQARTHNYWTDKPVSDEMCHQIYELAKWGPTAANTCPMRVVFVKSAAQKEQLLTCMAAGNIEKTKAAPVTAIIAMDMAFYEYCPTLLPHVDAKSWFVGNQANIDATAFRSSSLQGAYFMLAARALGLDCGPMSGFDAAKVDATFFADTTHKVNFIVNLGYGDKAKLHPRSPRLNFDEVCKIV